MTNRIIEGLKQALASASCEHEAEEPETTNDPRKPFGFDTWRCKKCGTKFYIPKDSK